MNDLVRILFEEENILAIFTENEHIIEKLLGNETDLTDPDFLTNFCLCVLQKILAEDPGMMHKLAAKLISAWCKLKPFYYLQGRVRSDSKPRIRKLRIVINSQSQI